MHFSVRFAISFSLLGVAVTTAPAASFATAPAGCFPVSLQAGKQTAVGLPLERSAVFTGRIDSVNGAVLTVSAAPGWATNALAGGDGTGEYHYCQVVTGSLAGARFPVLSNGTNSFLISDEGEDLAVLATDRVDGAGDQIRIVPYWTPQSVFSHTELTDDTALLILDGENGTWSGRPSNEFTYRAGQGWTDADGYESSNFPLRDGRGFFVRLPESASDLSLEVVGHVPMVRERQVFRGTTEASGSKVLFALNHPEALFLGEAGFEFGDRTTIFAFDEGADSMAHPARIFTYYDGYGWFDQVFRPVGDVALIEPGKAYLVRIPPPLEDCEWVWTRRPAYQDGVL